MNDRYAGSMGHTDHVRRGNRQRLGKEAIDDGVSHFKAAFEPEEATATLSPRTGYGRCYAVWPSRPGHLRPSPGMFRPCLPRITAGEAISVLKKALVDLVGAECFDDFGVLRRDQFRVHLGAVRPGSLRRGSGLRAPRTRTEPRGSVAVTSRLIPSCDE